MIIVLQANLNPSLVMRDKGGKESCIARWYEGNCIEDLYFDMITDRPISQQNKITTLDMF